MSKLLEDIKAQHESEMDISDSAIDWLIEQAERVEELEKIREIYEVRLSESFTLHLNNELHRTEKENNRLREALTKIYGILPIDEESLKSHKIAKQALAGNPK